MTLEKPSAIAESPFKSAKWDEITEGRSFTSAHIPILAMLCDWYEVLETCREDLTVNGQMRVAYMNDLGDVKAMPQIATMAKASTEIRQINKQLGINDEVKPEKPSRKTDRARVLELVTNGKREISRSKTG